MIKAIDIDFKQHLFTLNDLVINKTKYNLRENEIKVSDEELSLYIDAIFCRCPIIEAVFLWDVKFDVYTILQPNKFLIAVYKYMTGQMKYNSSLEGVESVPFVDLRNSFKRRIMETTIDSKVHIKGTEELVEFLLNIYK